MVGPPGLWVLVLSVVTRVSLFGRKATWSKQWATTVRASGVHYRSWVFARERRAHADVASHFAADRLRGERHRRSSERNFGLAAELLGSRIELRDLSVCELDSAEVGEVDLVVMGYVLQMLRDPLRCLEAVSRVCRDQLILLETVSRPLAGWLVDTHTSASRHARLWVPRPQRGDLGTTSRFARSRAGDAGSISAFASGAAQVASIVPECCRDRRRCRPLGYRAKDVERVVGPLLASASKHIAWWHATTSTCDTTRGRALAWLNVRSAGRVRRPRRPSSPLQRRSPARSAFGRVRVTDEPEARWSGADVVQVRRAGEHLRS
jgi:hypothetical protein